MAHSSRTVRAVGILTAHMLASSFNAVVASPDIARSLSGEQIAYAHDLCTKVIGVHPGEEHYNSCVSSLADSIQSSSREHAVTQARSQCFAQGLEPGSADLALCLLKATNANPGPGAWTRPDDVDAVDRMNGRTMSARGFNPTRGTISDREQQACARLGFDPAFADFANCVTKLQNAVQNIDTPSN